MHHPAIASTRLFLPRRGSFFPHSLLVSLLYLNLSEYWSRIPDERRTGDPEYKRESERRSSSSPDRSRAGIRLNDAQGDFEFHREKPRARAYVRESRQKATQEKGSSPPLSLSVSLSPSPSLGTRYMRCTCRCNPDSVKSGVS